VATPPTDGVASIEIDGGSAAQGAWEGDRIVWVIPQLAGQGGTATAGFVAKVDLGATGQIAAEAAKATASEWPDPALSEPAITFVGSGVPIWAIQGPGAASPYVRDQVTAEGIVVGAFADLHGFWIQEPETDDDPDTSAGLFVQIGDMEIAVKLGDRVRLSGKIRESSRQTTLQPLAPEDVEVLSSGNVLPDAVELDPPMDEAESREYCEALEGMLVKVSQPAVAVGPTSKYGETPLVRADWDVQRIMRGDPRGMLIFVDDGSDMTHQDQSTLPFALQTGDSVVDIYGPLAYTYENYKIEPIAVPVVTPVDHPLPTLEPVGPGEFSVATFNVQDLFDPYDPHPTDPPIPTTAYYKLDLSKTADAIRAMGVPTIVGLQEVENLQILTDLVEEPAIALYRYTPVLIEGTDSRGIDNGYLVRSDQATLEGVASLVAPGGLTSRPPLLITVTLHMQGRDRTVYLLNNHFTSMSGGELPTEPRRIAQAAWNVQQVQRILADDPEAYVMVLGDLNSFYHSPPMDEFRSAGMRHVYEFVEPEIPYTYIYEGESETLDHVWITPSLYEHLVRVEVLHINADFTLPLPDDATARHGSDHDPLVAVFSLE
jgi:predicted extracellular nuclease